MMTLSPPSSGEIINGTHFFALRVYYEDTDFSGVVYHASYLRFMERGRSEYIRLLGVEQGELFGEGAAFMVRAMKIDFLKPALVDDCLHIETTTQEVRGATMLLWQNVMRGAELLIKAEVKIAYVVKGRAGRIPDALKAKMGV
jgi:acyl-CoA thioester hydrolase